MFYATKINKVIGDKAIDVRGNVLSFVGYLPVTTGDTVFTDGNVIFGNAKVKGYSVVEEEDIKVPVLTANSVGEPDLRGFFNQKGRYKKYNVAEDDWIINTERSFEHGEGKLEEQKIIDVEFSTDGNLWIVTDGEYRDCQTLTFDNSLCVIRKTKDDDINGYPEGDDYSPYSAHLYVTPHIGSEITLGASNDSINNPVVIHKGEGVFDTINLRPYAEMAKAKSLENRAKIMAKSADTTGAVNFIKQLRPPASFVASTCAHVVSFKINKKGDWDAIIDAGAYGYCFPYLLLNGSVIVPTFNDVIGGSREFSAKLDRLKKNIERALFGGNGFAFLEVEKYPTFEGDVSDETGYTAEYQNYILAAMEYYIPRVRFTHYEWFVVAFGASMLFHVHNGQIVTTMQVRNFIGNSVYPHFNLDEADYYNKTNYAFVDISTPDELAEWQFPIGEDFYIIGKGAFSRGIINSKTGITLSIPSTFAYWRVTDLNDRIPNPNLAPDPLKYDDYNTRYFSTNIFAITETQSHYGVELVADEKAEAVANSENVAIKYVFNSEIRLPRAYYYPVSTNGDALIYNPYSQFPDERFDAPNLKAYRFVDGFFDIKIKWNGLDSESRDGIFRYNPSIAKLSAGKYLFGAHNENLWLRQSDQWYNVANHLKNFRLRELNRIIKAKETV